MDFIKTMTRRETKYSDSRGREREQRLLVPKRAVESEEFFSKFVPYINSRPFKEQYEARVKCDKIIVNDNFLKTHTRGRWTVNQYSAPTTIFNFEFIEDAMLVKMAGLFPESQDTHVTKTDHEKRLTYRSLQFSVTERRRLLQLLRNTSDDRNAALDAKLFRKMNGEE